MITLEHAEPCFRCVRTQMVGKILEGHQARTAIEDRFAWRNGRRVVRRAEVPLPARSASHPGCFPRKGDRSRTVTANRRGGRGAGPVPWGWLQLLQGIWAEGGPGGGRRPERPRAGARGFDLQGSTRQGSTRARVHTSCHTCGHDRRHAGRLSCDGVSLHSSPICPILSDPRQRQHACSPPSVEAHCIRRQ